MDGPSKTELRQPNAIPSRLDVNCREDAKTDQTNPSGVSISLSASSSEPCCRICQDGNKKERVVSPCRCAGSLGLFHPGCLEKWLARSHSNKCEVCGFEFKTIRTSRTFAEWLHTPSSRRRRRYVLIDTVCFFILTPLGCVSSWLCIHGAWEYYKMGQTWTGFALIMLTTFLLLMYFFWASITLRYHFGEYLKWQEDHQEVRIIFDDKVMVTKQNSREEPDGIDTEEPQCTA